MTRDEGKSNEFLSAPQWSQDRALAKADLICKAEEFMKIHGSAFRSSGEAIRRFLNLFNDKKIGEEIRESLPKKKISFRSFYRWKRSYESKGLVGLLEHYNNGGPKIDAEVMETIRTLIWKNHLSTDTDIFEDLHSLVSKDKIPSYATVRRHAKDFREKEWPALVLHHEGRKGLRDRNMLPVLGKMDEAIVRPLQRLEMDSTLADLFTGEKDSVILTKDGRRCKVLGVIDVYSRMAKVHLTERETGFMIGQLIRDRILAWGLPELIVIDNGKPYKNRRVLGFLRGLGVAVLICIPGCPEQKPFIERFFGTLTGKLFRRLRGYSGNSIKNKPKEIEIAYTKDELQEIIDRWIENVYAETVHSGTGQRPRERMNLPGFKAVTVSARDLDILLMEQAERTVRQGFISFDGARFFHQKLPEGRKVSVRINDFDASELLVYANGQYICTAVDPARKGWTPQEKKEAKKLRNQELRTRIKANRAFQNKTERADESILSQIENAEKKSPVMLPRKAELIPFPEHERIQFTGDERPAERFEPPPCEETPESLLIRSNQEMYLYVRRKELAGLELEEHERAFLDHFIETTEFRLIGAHLDHTLEKEVSAGGK
jgi:transposase InsO family protein